jgi:hypothetical protein
MEQPMTRIQLAGYMLIASACVIGAILMVRVADFGGNEAHAEMVVSRSEVTVLSTRINQEREMVYVLDNRDGRLLGYLIDPARERMELAGVFDVNSYVRQFMDRSQQRRR